MYIQPMDVFWSFLLVIKIYMWVVLYVGVLVKKNIFSSLMRMKNMQLLGSKDLISNSCSATN